MKTKKLPRSIKKAQKLIESLKSGELVTKKSFDTYLITSVETTVGDIIRLEDEVDSLKEELKSKKKEIELKTEEVKAIRKKIKKSLKGSTKKD